MYFSREWLENELATLQTEEEKVRLKMIFLNSCSDLLIKETSEICAELAVKAERENDTALKAFVIIHNSYFRLASGDVQEANRKAQEAEQLAIAAPASPMTSIVLQMCAFNYWTAGFRDRALELAYSSRKQLDGKEDEGMGWSDFQLAVFHSDLKDYETALNYFNNAEQMAVNNKLVYQLARIRSGLGAIAIAQDRFEDALTLTEQAIEGYRECGHTTAMSRALNDLGVIYFKRGDLQLAKKNLSEAIESRRNANYFPGLITSEIELAKVHIEEKEYHKAQQLLEDALQLSIKTRSRQKEVTCHMLLSSLHKLNGNFTLALQHLEEGYDLKTDLAGDEASNRIKHLQQKHATEQAERIAEIERSKNAELKQAYDAIEEQNKSILDSINYAQRIQTALLGSRAMMNAHIPDNFILYKPKDIVSGDFWWCAEEQDRFYFAVADCTGHGVPGAFMSLLNINLLNRALNEHLLASPAELLDQVRKQVINSLNRDGQETARDGMDVVICSLHKNGKLDFACANNALVLVRDGAPVIHGPDKFHVGLSHGEELQQFTAHSIQLQKGDSVYLTTDGFSDQFGGEKGKKFKQKRLRELFVNNAALPLDQQEKLLVETFDSWKGRLEQVDDVLIIGFRYN